MGSRHRRALRGVLAAGCAGLVATALWGTVSRAQAPDRPDPDTADWDTATIDISLRRSILEADGTLRGAPSPVVRYRWQRARSRGQWKTILTLLSSAAPIVESEGGPLEIENPFAILRLEDDEDGTPPRVYDAHGRQVRLPFGGLEQLRPPGMPGLPDLPALDYPSADGRPVPPGRPVARGPEWLEQFVAERSQRGRRVGQLESRFGPPRERVGGLDRYVRTSDDTTVEILVEPDLAMPVETNTVRGGALVVHSLYRYESRAGGALVRRSVRTERPLDGTGRGRSVLDVEFSDPRLERIGGVQ